jgi:hypothetical protein
VSFAISPSGHFKDTVYPYLRPFACLFGTFQAWNLFSPELRTTNGHATAIITFADGSTKFFEFPRMEKLDSVGKLKREKLRKLFLDNLSDSSYGAFRPAVARELAQANNDPNNPPQLVTLKFHWISTPPPENWLYRDHFPYHTTHDCQLVYRVQPEDLK